MKYFTKEAISSKRILSAVMDRTQPSGMIKIHRTNATARKQTIKQLENIEQLYIKKLAPNPATEHLSALEKRLAGDPSPRQAIIKVNHVNDYLNAIMKQHIKVIG